MNPPVFHQSYEPPRFQSGDGNRHKYMDEVTSSDAPVLSFGIPIESLRVTKAWETPEPLPSIDIIV
jgi:hypothetical protein